MTWQRAAELLESREYEQVARLLREQQEAVQRSGQMTLVIMLAAACQLCLTCRQFQADRELHQLGLDKARRREQESRRQIRAVLTMLSQLASPDDLAAMEALIPSESQSGVKESATSASEEQLTLFQKVKQLLGFESAAGETAAEPPVSLDRPETGASLPIDQEALSEQLQQFIASTIEGKEVARPSEASVADQTAAEEAGSEIEKSSAQPEAADEEGELVGDSRGVRVSDEKAIKPTDKSVGVQTSEENESKDLVDLPGETQPSPRDEPVLSSSMPSRQSAVSHETKDPDQPSLAVYCLGPFQTYLNEQAIERWPSGKGKSIFKYLINHHRRPAPKEVLMDLFWPDADPDAARNNLNVAIYGLRQAFRGTDTEISTVLYQNDSYLLNPELHLWLDVEEFETRFQNGQRLYRIGSVSAAVQEYHTAKELYQGEFLEDDPYEEWPILQREALKDDYLIILDRLSRYYFQSRDYVVCTDLCQEILTNDACREDAHRRLMRCYYQQGQRNLALRQYHTCVKALADILDVRPMEETTELYQQLRNGGLEEEVHPTDGANKDHQ